MPPKVQFLECYKCSLTWEIMLWLFIRLSFIENLAKMVIMSMLFSLGQKIHQLIWFKSTASLEILSDSLWNLVLHSWSHLYCSTSQNFAFLLFLCVCVSTFFAANYRLYLFKAALTVTVLICRREDSQFWSLLCFQVKQRMKLHMAS